MYENQLLISNFDEIHLIVSFVGLLICLYEHNCRKLPKNAYFGRFWQGEPPKSQCSKKNVKFVKFHFMLVCLEFHVNWMSVSEDISMLRMIHLPIFPMKLS